MEEQQTQPAPAPSSGGSGFWFFRCFRNGKERKPKQANLSAVQVVPAEAAQAPQKWVGAGVLQSQTQEAKEQPPPPQSEEQQPPQKAEPETSTGLSSEASTEPGSGVSAVPVVQVCAEHSQQTPRTEDNSIMTQATDSTEQGAHVPISPKSQHQVLQARGQGEAPQLGPQAGPNIGRKCLVLDLDETLVHSSFRAVQNADIIISVEIEGEDHQVFVRKRPGCDEFLLRVAELYEIVIYTASMSKYASPLLDQLDPHRVCHWRLYREACTRLSAGYVKDLSRLGRDLKHVIIIDNSPICYSMQPDNAIPIQTWRDDVNDRELLDLIPILISLADVDDIPQVLRQIIWAGDDEAFENENG